MNTENGLEREAGERNKMLEKELEDLGNQEQFKNAVLLFNQLKSKEQEKILERASITPLEAIKSIINDFKIQEELAQVVFTLENDYKISKKLSTSYFLYELNRLKRIDFELPYIHSYFIRFSMEEGFWTKFFLVDFPKKIHLKALKLLTLDSKLFGNLSGNKEDSALYIIERAYIVNEQIRPILYSWIQDHPKSTFYDATINAICIMRQKAKEKGETILKELENKYYSNIETLKPIIAELDEKGWANKAIKEFKNILQGIEDCRKDIKNINWRIAAELVLENHLISEYETKDLEEELFSNIPREQTKKESPFEAKKEDMVQDKLTFALIKLENMPKEMVAPVVDEVVKDNYNKAMKILQKKPLTFMEEFLNRISTELKLNQFEAQKVIKKARNDLTYKLSPMGIKEYPTLTIDDKIITLLKEIVVDIIINREKYGLLVENEPIKKIGKQEIPVRGNKELTREKKVDLTKKMKEASDNELMILVRDSYLKELFEGNDEIIAGAKTLKKLSIELGLLLSEREATTFITAEYDPNKLTSPDKNSEEIDKKICEIVFKKIVELKESQIKTFEK